MINLLCSLLLWGCIVYLILNRALESPKKGKVHVLINSTVEIGQTDQDFICATLDWWPPDKCDYGTCTWATDTLLNLDLNNTNLLNAVKAFWPLKIRMGGTLQDRLIYQTNEQLPCNTFVKDNSQFLGFSQGCLPMSRWDDLNLFFKHTGAVVTFGLNALTGRTVNPEDGWTTGAWDPRNAESLLRYTVDKGYSIHGWELGNELSGDNGIGAKVTAQQYASDVKTLHTLVERIYVNSQVKPLVIGPGGFYDNTWFPEFIAETTNSLQAVSHHIYNLGAGVDDGLEGRILDPSYLDKEATTFSNLQQAIRNSGTSAVAWVSEAGGAYNSGHNHVTNAFVMSFWYLDQLGMAATFGTKTYCRQSLVGGNYGLLKSSTFVPNPDYYSALLWHRLMGRQVLSTSVSGIKTLRAYTHCSKQSQGMTLLLINLDGQTNIQVSVSTDRGSILAETRGSPVARRSKFEKMPIIRDNTREEYHLTAPNRNLNSQKMLLNGKVLKVDSNGNIPVLEPAIVKSSDPVNVAPLSIVFVHIPNIVSQTCTF
ncbi:heparanase-like protein 3 [Silene latifolia]|uniref:heparanase-like protein 3 n=1 Tax=Silene latifolia TaxID=37657 RepID=UPI003D77E727